MPVKERLAVGAGLAMAALILGNIAYWIAIRFFP